MHYLDTSFVAPLILPETTSERVERFIRKIPVGQLAVSHWTRVEFASLVARRARMGDLTAAQAAQARDAFEKMLTESFHIIIPQVNDYDVATHLLRNYKTGLRAGDALHLALVKNHGAAIMYSLDKQLIKAAKILKIPASAGIRL